MPGLTLINHYYCSYLNKQQQNLPEKIFSHSPKSIFIGSQYCNVTSRGHYAISVSDAIAAQIITE